MRAERLKDKCRSTEPGDPLDARAREVLRAVIRSHIDGALPVGSAAIARTSSEHLSPATIRAVMSQLEDQGLLTQPHTSAGRIPTERAWKLYAAWMLSAAEERATAPHPALSAAVGAAAGEVPAIMRETSRLLSRLSRQVALVTAPAVARMVIARIEFVALERRRVLTVLVDPAGVVLNRIVELGESVPQAVLDRLARTLEDQFRGLTLPEAREALLGWIGSPSGVADRDLWRALPVAEGCLGAPDAAPGLFIEGTANLLRQPEFGSAGDAAGLLQLLEDRTRLLEIVTRCLGDDPVSVLIGSDTGEPCLVNCAVLAAPYTADGRALGAIGIVGPARMPYEQAIPLVSGLAAALGQLLSTTTGEE